MVKTKTQQASSQRRTAPAEGAFWEDLVPSSSAPQAGETFMDTPVDYYYAFSALGPIVLIMIQTVNTINLT
jgi:hypothetical protein